MRRTCWGRSNSTGSGSALRTASRPSSGSPRSPPPLISARASGASRKSRPRSRAAASDGAASAMWGRTRCSTSRCTLTTRPRRSAWRSAPRRTSARRSRGARRGRSPVAPTAIPRSRVLLPASASPGSGSGRHVGGRARESSVGMGRRHFAIARARHLARRARGESRPDPARSIRRRSRREARPAATLADPQSASCRTTMTRARRLRGAGWLRCAASRSG